MGGFWRSTGPDQTPCTEPSSANDQLDAFIEMARAVIACISWHHGNYPPSPTLPPFEVTQPHSSCYLSSKH